MLLSSLVDLDSSQLEAALLETAEDLANEATLDAVRLRRYYC
jgi:hypothetical protein